MNQKVPKKDTYVLKCLFCVTENADRTGSLPIICPNTKMPCFMLLPEQIRSCLHDHPQNLETARIPMSSSYIDQEVVARMKTLYKTLA